MKLTIQQTETMSEVEIRFVVRGDFEVGVEMSQMCGSCAGYGSPCRHCTEGRLVEKHTVDSLKARLGSAYPIVCANLLKLLQ